MPGDRVAVPARTAMLIPFEVLAKGNSAGRPCGGPWGRVAKRGIQGSAPRPALRLGPFGGPGGQAGRGVSTFCGYLELSTFGQH